MTTSLQDLIDDALFLSTEHQARLAELSQGAQWDVDFSAPTFTLQTDPPLTLTPHLLGTDSASRESWIWAWQELGHFPSQVVAAAVQTREAGRRSSTEELTRDELPAQEGLARRVTLASKAVTGLWAHYPAQVGGQVTAWLLLEGPELDLPPAELATTMRVIGESLQTGTAVDHHRALDSYARLRGVHIAWDTDATCILTLRDGAQRFWLEDRQITGVEPADPQVGEQELARLEEQARAAREALAADRQDALRLAEEQAQQDAARRQEQEQTRRERTAAELEHEDAQAEPTPVAGSAQEPLPSELSPEDLEAPLPQDAQESADAEGPAYEVSREDAPAHQETARPEPVGASAARRPAQDQPVQEDPLEEHFPHMETEPERPAAQEPLHRPEQTPEPAYGGAAEDMPFDQEPRRDVAPGEVTTSTVPSAAPHRDQEPVRRQEREDLRGQEREVVPADEREPEQVHEPVEQEQTRRDEPQRKKGFLSRFFGSL